jgi:hypothetical protein
MITTISRLNCGHKWSQSKWHNSCSILSVWCKHGVANSETRITTNTWWKRSHSIHSAQWRSTSEFLCTHILLKMGTSISVRDGRLCHWKRTREKKDHQGLYRLRECHNPAHCCGPFSLWWSAHCCSMSYVRFNGWSLILWSLSTGTLVLWFPLSSSELQWIPVKTVRETCSQIISQGTSFDLFPTFT